jgi:hypothetical protein
MSSRLEKPTIVKVDDIKIPVSSLKEQLESYEKIKREKDMIKIRKIKDILGLA